VKEGFFIVGAREGATGAEMVKEGAMAERGKRKEGRGKDQEMEKL
jgi:hypothetical protein